ncbi:uncharacterized protein LOC135694008 isoform X2 [Rhopilema esculentum]|uniref:uncharacterized protein LOC135694008 isoform X2 n=1 Tax=Rhopilema esculentum TaxID=499914 RepID=UPI0031CF7186
MAASMCRSSILGSLVRSCSAFSRRNFSQRPLQNEVEKFSCSVFNLHSNIFRAKPSLVRCNQSSADLTIRNPSDFQKVEYAVPKDVVGKILGKDKQVVNQIKALSGSVIRIKKDEEVNITDEKAYFIIGGNKKQISKAIELIEEKISKKSLFDSKDGFLIWSNYRRNFKGQRAPQTTRHKCIRSGGNKVSGNPCPLCRLKLEKNKDVDYKQFVCPHSGQVLPATLTGLCRQQQDKIVANIEKSRQYGLLPFTVPLPEEIVPEYKPVGIPSKHVRIRQ